MVSSQVKSSQVKSSQVKSSEGIINNQITNNTINVTIVFYSQKSPHITTLHHHMIAHLGRNPPDSEGRSLPIWAEDAVEGRGEVLGERETEKRMSY